MRWLCLLLMTEGVKRLDQQYHVYSIHSKRSDYHAEEITDENDASPSVLNASLTDAEYPGASCDIPGSPQVQ
jgi:hypothetical protein